ncbi:Uncharacterised protein, partial [Mycoplasma putrefaciens]
MGAEIKYSLVKPKNTQQKFIIASDLIASVSQEIGW